MAFHERLSRVEVLERIFVVVDLYAQLEGVLSKKYMDWNNLWLGGLPVNCSQLGNNLSKIYICKCV